MNLLLDTHALLWFLQGADEARGVRGIVETAENFVSAASLWEAASKASLGKLTLPYDVLRLPELCAKNGFGVIDVSARDAVRVAALPFHHRDPFDRLIAAQCLERGLPLLSRDDVFDAYGVRRIWR